MRSTLYRNICLMLVVMLIAWGKGFALDLTAYSPTRNDAIRNGLYLVYGPEAGKYASVELPVAHNAVANVYDYRVNPVVAPCSLLHKSRTNAAYIVDGGDASLGGAGDTVYYQFTLVDTSRLDSSLIALETKDIFNRISLKTSGSSAGITSIVFNDADRNEHLDSEHDIILQGSVCTIVPGETLYVGVALIIPERGMRVACDTVTLECRTDLDRPDNRQLRMSFKNIVRFREGAPLFARPTEDTPWRDPLVLLTETWMSPIRGAKMRQDI